MGTKRILVDATHHEQTRVALLDGNVMEDFEVEVTAKKPLKGNIYLARISRIEPSLQAAFVEYGGNRHGFLPFSEIHPDYFLISKKEREEINEFYNQKRTKPEETELETPPVLIEDDDKDNSNDDEDDELENNLNYSRVKDANFDETKEFRAANADEANIPPHRRFNIQDVLKRRQILLVQVSKEERGNKGAALTTYLSIAGRYCVLMPNTNHTGGVSRRITSVADRRRLRDILGTLNTPDNMAVIIRTAGAQKSKLDIQRDYEYLLRVWSNIRGRVFESFTPSLVYEEANLIKRTIRDMYSREIMEILIVGTQGFEAAKELTSLLIPNQLNKLRKYDDSRIALFQRWNTEAEIEKLFEVEAVLPSGGYLVINPTEALVAIDVNSGKATSEGSVEETALATNLEAAVEVARQLRMRNLAGLVVIDFIDMEVGRHRTMVERKLKEALQKDRSRIQVGKISPFGLLELSRQRTSPSLVEAIATPCPHCQGHGLKWSVEASGLHIVRAVEHELMKSSSSMIVHAGDLPTLWILNEKRDWINRLERHYNIRLSFISDSSLTNTAFRIDRIAAPKPQEVSQHVTSSDITMETSKEEEPAEPSKNTAMKRKRKRRKPKYLEKRKNQNQQSTQQSGQNQSGSSVTIPIETAEKPEKALSSDSSKQNQQSQNTKVTKSEEKPKQTTRRTKAQKTAKTQDEKPAQPKSKQNPEKIKDEKPAQPKAKQNPERIKDEKPAQPKAKQNPEKIKDEKPAQPKAKQNPERIKDEKPAQPKSKPKPKTAKKSGWWNKKEQTS